LLLVGSYLIKADLNQAMDGGPIYLVKPFTRFTLYEKRNAKIIKRKLD
jgi:hypothetical protein